MEIKIDNQYNTDRYSLINADTTEAIKLIPDESVHLITYSPPFASLYTYSNSDRDLGNSKTDEEFYTHFEFIVHDLFRILMPGRIMAVHCMQIPAMKERDGYIGLKDFRGDMIRLFQKCGFIYHSEVTVYKSPVVEMQRTKALGLLHKQVKKDSSMSRMGIPDYIIIMRKPGDNSIPITHTNETYSVDKWQRVAEPCWEIYPSPVWWDINQTDTLNARVARTDEEERHLCPLQLPVIERIVDLYSNPDEIVMTPFLGIGSEVYQAVKMDRKGLGIELKKTYFDVAVNNMQSLDLEKKQMSIFDFLGDN